MSLPVALGLFTVRDLYQENFDACLEKTAAIGYAGVECFGKPSLPAEVVTASLKKHHLTLVGWHLPIDALEGDAFEETVAYLRQVNCPRAVVPFEATETFTQRKSILAFADRLNAIHKRLEPHGIALGYHNHEAEFLPLDDGALPWAVLMDHTNIFGQLDNGNALASRTPGLDVNKVVSDWPGRATTLHLKPYSQRTGFESMIGQDDIDWPNFLYIAEHTGGAKWLIVEYEAEDMTQFEGAAECFHALESLN